MTDEKDPLGQAPPPRRFFFIFFGMAVGFGVLALFAPTSDAIPIMFGGFLGAAAGSGAAELLRRTGVRSAARVALICLTLIAIGALGYALAVVLQRAL